MPFGSAGCVHTRNRALDPMGNASKVSTVPGTPSGVSKVKVSDAGPAYLYIPQTLL